jgi:hypothetical protein
MTRDEFVFGLQMLGAVERRAHPSGQEFIVLEAQPVPGTGSSTRVAFLVGDVLDGRPPAFVDGTLRTRTGGSPNNWATTVVNSEIFGSWSFQCEWSPASDAPETLVYAVLAQWDR